jgi:hypothetical protein
MSIEQFQLVESSIGQVELNASRFAENFVSAIDQMSSVSPTLVPSRLEIDPLQFLLKARDRFKQIEETSDDTSIVPGLVPDAAQFNLAANAMLCALAKTLGPDLNPGTRDAWIAALHVIAGDKSATRTPARINEQT